MAWHSGATLQAAYLMFIPDNLIDTNEVKAEAIGEEDPHILGGLDPGSWGKGFELFELIELVKKR